MPLAVLLKAHVAKAKWEPILNVVPQYTGFHVSQPRNCSLTMPTAYFGVACTTSKRAHKWWYVSHYQSW